MLVPPGQRSFPVLSSLVRTVTSESTGKVVPAKLKVAKPPATTGKPLAGRSK